MELKGEKKRNRFWSPHLRAALAELSAMCRLEIHLVSSTTVRAWGRRPTSFMAISMWCELLRIFTASSCAMLWKLCPFTSMIWSPTCSPEGRSHGVNFIRQIKLGRTSKPVFQEGLYFYHSTCLCSPRNFNSLVWNGYYSRVVTSSADMVSDFLHTLFINISFEWASQPTSQKTIEWTMECSFFRIIQWYFH